MVLQRRTGRLGAALLAGALLVSGCQNMDDTRTTQAQGTAGGAVLGAILGAVIGGGKGAAIGGAAGAALGLGVGSVVAQRKRQYASAEDFYDAQIHQTEATNWQLAQYNEGLGRQIADNRQQIAMLQTQVRDGNVDYQAASQTRARIQANYAESAKMLANSRHELEAQKQVAEDLRRSAGEQASRTRQENEQVAALSSHVDVLQQQVETMASQSNQLQQFR